MVYVDTSVLVALHLNETNSNKVARWYAASSEKLISASWCVTEFASALGIKRRTGQITEAQGQFAWQQFERMCANDLRLVPVAPITFHDAALLTLDAKYGLRAGDALHLAAALAANAKSMATLDLMLEKNAKRMKLKIAKF